MRSAVSLLILLVCCRCAAVPVDHPGTAKALVENAIAIYEQDKLLQNNFYSDENLKRVSGATTVDHARLETPSGADWRERIWTFDFPGMEPPTKVWSSGAPTVHFEPQRTVKNGRVISASLFVAFQATYVNTRRSVISPLLGPSCREDENEESAMVMAIAREPFNPPLGRKHPLILSCKAKGKRMIIDFGLAEAGADPTLTSIRIFEEEN